VTIGSFSAISGSEMASRRTNATEGQQRSRTTSQSTTARPKSLFVADNAVPNNNSETTAMAAPSSRPINMHKLPGLEAESNIQVFVRCRGRSAREKSEGAANIVNIDGPMAKEVVIQTAAAKTELGVTTPAATRTYPFDRVFGFAADQAMIYQEVVKPMLEEVLLGYNCTLFAYGQTGTGKT
jgi:kinesin family member 11